MGTKLEVEGKFRITDEDAARSLMELAELAGFALGEAHTARIKDQYYDSPSRALLRAGWALRWRATEGKSIATLKALDGGEAPIKKRTEIEETFSLDAAPPALPPGPLASTVEEFTPVASLVPLVAIEQQRVSRVVLRDGASLAELSIDAVSYPGNKVSWEAEVECLDPAKEDVIRTIGRVLAEEWGLELEPRSKFERALESVDGIERAARDHAEADEERERDREAGPADPIEVFAAAAIRKNLRALSSGLGAAAEGADPELVHETRIAARRLRTCIAVFGGRLDPKLARKAARRLKRLCRGLGEVRDLDVLIADAMDYGSALGSDKDGGFAAFVSELKRRKELALARLGQLAGHEDTERMYAQLRALAKAAVRQGRSSPPAPAGLEATSMLASMFSELIGFGALMRAGKAAQSAYHETRRAAKRLRYTLEFFEALLGPGAERCSSEAKVLQDHLGALNDALFASRTTATYLAARIGPGADATGTRALRSVQDVARYLDRRQRQSARLMKAIPGVWARISSPAFRKRFYSVLGSCPVAFSD